VTWAISFFREFGALEFAQKEAERLVVRAEEVLGRLPLAGDGRERFRAVADFIIRRTA
jgi:geranylgeranyl pyrophosphate synthase